MPEDTAAAWVAIGPILPDGVVLYGGTAIAVRLGHRVSRDLDFFVSDASVDLGRIRTELELLRPTAVGHHDERTLDAAFGSTKVRFLRSEGQCELEPPEVIEGIRVARLRDLASTKLNAIVGRDELRDYFDLMEIERRTGLTVEVAISDLQARYGTDDPIRVVAVVRAIGYFGDVVADPTLPMGRAAIERYWRARQGPLVRVLSGIAPETGSPSEP